ncbi:hypothetical protein NMG60_11020022 [Bertholletia excelsa]
MGEEVKQEQANPEEKKEKQTKEKKEEKTEEKMEEEPKPPPLFVLLVDLHCVGCAKKIERSILKIRGVERVVTDMSQNQVTIKGVVEPQAVCDRITKKTKRRAQVLSPLPPAEGEPLPQLVNSQVRGLTTVELNVNMHCEACAEQLKTKILKMRGVRTATTEFSTGKVMVTGTMDADKLVDYVYRRTKKQAKIVLPPEPEKPAEAEAEPKAEEKKDEPAAAPAEEPKQEEKKEENAGEKPPEEEKKTGESKEEGKNNEGEAQSMVTEEQRMQRMMYYYEPLYVIERIPPPQLFSDENPNACCIT